MDELKQGTIHPLSFLAEEAYKVFTDMGFEIATGPELESEWYNFDVLNVSKDHPARDMQDTFIIKGEKEKVQRTHTTSVTGRAVEQANKDGRMPCAFISIGKVFRNEATDATHEMQFYQIDGAMVGENISVADMKGVLTHFYKKMLGEDRNLSTAKVGSFFNQSYDEVRGELNIRNYDFYISLEGGANSSGLAASKGKKSSNSENVISLRRYTTYQNENSVLSFELWK